LAGTGEAGFSGDGGAAEKAALNAPRGLAVDDQDNIYIADTGNNRIRWVSSGGIIKTIAGSDPSAGKAGASAARFADADKAMLLSPTTVAPDREGNLFVTESACKIGERKPTVWVLKQKM
jgi:DNA-binding beta-propeller fold protein YncE